MSERYTRAASASSQVHRVAPALPTNGIEAQSDKGIVDHIAENLLDDYALGRLNAAVLPAVEEHLLLCEHCRSQVLLTDAVIEALGGAGQSPVVND